MPALMTTFYSLQKDPVLLDPDNGGHSHMRVNNLIREAIHKKRLLRLSMHNHDPHAALHVEPHAYGLNGQGKPSLLCYRISDPCAVGEGWKILSLTAIQSVEIAPVAFSGPRPGYRRNDTTIAAVFAQL